jgi:hypothetical protein
VNALIVRRDHAPAAAGNAAPLDVHRATRASHPTLLARDLGYLSGEADYEDLMR